MKHLKRYTEHVNEMAQISRKGKTVYADDKPLKDVPVEELDSNIALIYLEGGTFMTPPGKFWIYFLSDPKWIDDYKNQKSDMLMFPVRTRSNMFTVSPINDVWKKSRSKDVKNAEMIIGIAEGVVYKGKIFIEMMSTRPGYKQNTVNKKLIASLQNRWPDYPLVWEDPTEDGLEFISRYSKDKANFRFTTQHRAKNWKQLYPDLAREDEDILNKRAIPGQNRGEIVHIGPDMKKEEVEE